MTKARTARLAALSWLDRIKWDVTGSAWKHTHDTNESEYQRIEAECCQLAVIQYVQQHASAILKRLAEIKQTQDFGRLYANMIFRPYSVMLEEVVPCVLGLRPAVNQSCVDMRL